MERHAYTNDPAIHRDNLSLSCEYDEEYCFQSTTNHLLIPPDHKFSNSDSQNNQSSFNDRRRDPHAFTQEPHIDTDVYLWSHQTDKDYARLSATEHSLAREVIHLDIQDTIASQADVHLTEVTATQPSQQSNKRKGLGALKVFLFKSKSKMGLTIIKKPKEEFVRIKLLRGHKRATRQSIGDQVPKKTLHFVDSASVAQMEAWKGFCKFNCENRGIMMETSRTDNGPHTYGAARRSLRLDQINGRENIQRTFGFGCCSEYFSNDIVVQSFLLYIDILFADLDCNLLCERFQFRCCEQDVHTALCNQHWLELKNQLKGIST